MSRAELARPCITTSPADRWGYFGATHPRVFAHRGGAGRWPENTLLAFKQASAIGCEYIETDLWATRDGVLVLHHDAHIERTTNGSGSISQLTWPELQGVDAGYGWTDERGQTPYRGRGLRIPSLAQALALDPTLRFNIDLKPRDSRLVTAAWEFIEAHGAHQRVLIASSHAANLRAFRHLAGTSVATSAGSSEALAFLCEALLGGPREPPPFQALQVPKSHYGLPVVTRRLLTRAHSLGIEVHVWTINDSPSMQALLALGVDGIVTDQPQLALAELDTTAGR